MIFVDFWGDVALAQSIGERYHIFLMILSFSRNVSSGVYVALFTPGSDGPSYDVGQPGGGDLVGVR